MLQALLLILFFYLVGKAYRAVRRKLGIQPKIKSDEEKEQSKLRVSWFIIAGIVILLVTFAYASYKNTSEQIPLTPITSVGTQQQSQQVSPNISTEDLLRLTNNERLSIGIPALAIDDRLNSAATDKCNDMAAKGYENHTAPDGTTDLDFFKKYISQASGTGANLAEGYNTAGEVVSAWLNSPGHKKNIDEPLYKYVGFAVCNKSVERQYVVQFFLRP